MSTIKCLVCGKTQKKIFSKKKYSYYKCVECGLVSTLPIPDKKTIVKHYRNNFNSGNYFSAREYSDYYMWIYNNFVEIILSELKKHGIKSIKNFKVLDIGCFTGDFLSILKKKGAKVYGLELQSEAVEIARKKLKTKNIFSSPKDFKGPKGSFDLITLQGLIEHVEDPLELIKFCSSQIKKGGFIMIQTPNAGSLFSRLLKRYWPPYAPVEHIHFFDRKGLSSLLKTEGFEVTYYKNHWKKMPINYLYNNLHIFGTELLPLVNPFYKILPSFLKKRSVYFYVGEMIVMARKK